MRKNKSLKDCSFKKDRRSKGKEISIDIEGNLQKHPDSAHR